VKLIINGLSVYINIIERYGMRIGHLDNLKKDLDAIEHPNMKIALKLSKYVNTIKQIDFHIDKINELIKGLN